VNHFLPSLLTISAALALGALVNIVSRHFASGPDRLARLRIQIQKACLLGINPVAFIGAVWILPISDHRLLLLPVVGLLVLVSGFLIGGLVMRLRPLPSAGERIGFRLSCSFTNTGNMGGLIVYLLLGELAFSMIPFYKLLEEFWYYGVLFPYARQQAVQGGLIKDTGQTRNGLLRVLTDPFFLVIALSILLGLALNVLGFARPDGYARINAWIIPSSSFLLLVAIGSQIRIVGIPRYWKPAALIATIRVTLIPLFALSFALLLGLGNGDTLTIKTIAILATMPMAFISLVPASLYNLDADLISTAWIFTTASLILSVPVLSHFLS